MNPISVLLVAAPDPGAPDLHSDFTAAGFAPRGPVDGAQLVREALRAPPDAVACWAPRTSADLLQSIAALQAQQPVPVLVFTADAEVATMQRALAAGVHAWVVQGYAPARLRTLVQLAQARAARELRWRAQLVQLEQKLEDRKWVERAKGILMRAQQVSEDEAFQLLRTASQQVNRRVGEVSRQVIDAARAADAINRAGQQRMLSQRLVKLYALACHETDAHAALGLLRASLQRVEDNLGALRTELPAPDFADLLAAAQEGWRAMREILQAPPRASRLAVLDERAEAVLLQAQALVTALETWAGGARVHVLATCARQRMLSQRAAKLALLRAGAADAGAIEDALGRTVTEFEEALSTLRDAPLSTPGIRGGLQRGEVLWQELRAAIAAGEAGGRLRLAAASEALLELFDALTADYQHSVQVLLGGSARASPAATLRP